MKKIQFKYNGKCKICGKPLNVGDYGWFQKNPVSGKTEVFCMPCIDSHGTAPAPTHDYKAAPINCREIEATAEKIAERAANWR